MAWASSPFSPLRRSQRISVRSISRAWGPPRSWVRPCNSWRRALAVLLMRSSRRLMRRLRLRIGAMPCSGSSCSGAAEPCSASRVNSWPRGRSTFSRRKSTSPASAPITMARMRSGGRYQRLLLRSWDWKSQRVWPVLWSNLFSCTQCPPHGSCRGGWSRCSLRCSPNSRAMASSTSRSNRPAWTGVPLGSWFCWRTSTPAGRGSSACCNTCSTSTVYLLSRRAVSLTMRGSSSRRMPSNRPR